MADAIKTTYDLNPTTFRLTHSIELDSITSIKCLGRSLTVSCGSLDYTHVFETHFADAIQKLISKVEPVVSEISNLQDHDFKVGDRVRAMTGIESHVVEDRGNGFLYIADPTDPTDRPFQVHHSWLKLVEKRVKPKKRIKKAIKIAVRYGGIDGDHHKAWVIDQMVRLLAGHEYAKIVHDACHNEDGEQEYDWSVGIAP